MSCDGPHVPQVLILNDLLLSSSLLCSQVYLYQTNPNQRMLTLVDNAKLSADLSSKSLPKVSNLNIPVDGGKYQAKVRLYLPPDFSESKKYPLVINVYGGPNSQQVQIMF